MGLKRGLFHYSDPNLIPHEMYSGNVSPFLEMILCKTKHAFKSL